MQLESGLLLVLINSNLWYRGDDKMSNHSDPAGQFVWLENILKDAQESNSSVSFCKLSHLLHDCHFNVFAF